VREKEKEAKEKVARDIHREEDEREQVYHPKTWKTFVMQYDSNKLNRQRFPRVHGHIFESNHELKRKRKSTLENRCN
jgi:hypothetical protein